MGTARMWYRRSRNNWKSWQDFCRDIRIAFGPDRRMQDKLVAEAYYRTQGPEEPVRDYIECMLAIVEKNYEHWSEEKILDLLHRNMLPSLQKQINRLYVTSVKDLCDFAYEAENVLEEERLYQPPPLPENSVMPKSAYKIPSKKSNASKVPYSFKSS